MLCAVCVSVFQGPSKRGDHHFSFANLQKAADSGCKICSHLYRLRIKRGQDTAAEESTTPFARFEFESWDQKSWHLAFNSPASWFVELETRVQLHVSPRDSVPDWWPYFLERVEHDVSVEPWRVREDEFPSRSIPTSTGSVEVANLALEWFDSCRHSHSTCETIDEYRQSEWFPTRLLEVGNLESETCRLILTESEKPAKGSRYATLSHCWGNNPSFITLTSDNLQTLQQGISSKCLPRSFSDILQTCRRLGIRYLWIDSLCILQSGPGSDDDWQKHAADMDTIYANCVLNLAVDHASNPDHGAFVERDPRFLQTAFVYIPAAMGLQPSTKRWDTLASSIRDSDEECVVSGESGNPSGDALGGGMFSLVTVFAGTHDFQFALYEQPLQRRGWVFQERLMAPRVLHFGSDRVYWECNEKRRDEYLPRGLTGSGDMFDTHWQKIFNLPTPILQKRTTPPELSRDQVNSLLSVWHELVDIYSQCDLTFPKKDRLMAVAAIAKRFGHVLPGSYYAGIFGTDFPLGLLWYNCYETRASAQIHTKENSHRIVCDLDGTRDPANHLPSWSWASVDVTRATNSYAPWAYMGHPYQVSWRTFVDIDSVATELVDSRNPYGQILSAKLVVSGPLLPLSTLKVTSPRSGEDATGTIFEGQVMFCLCIMEEIRSDHPYTNSNSSEIYGIVLAQKESNIYRRMGTFRWSRRLGDATNAPVEVADYRRTCIEIV